MSETPDAEPDGAVVLTRGDDDTTALETVWSGTLQRTGAAQSLCSFPTPAPATPTRADPLRHVASKW